VLKQVIPLGFKGLMFSLAYSSTLRLEAKYSSETSVNFQRTTWRYIPEYSTLVSGHVTRLWFSGHFVRLTAFTRLYGVIR
jgi:hypothetical protein